MKHYTDKLKEFNKAFGIKTPCNIDASCELRFKLMKEENEEYFDSLFMEDPKKELVDAIADMLYILSGTIVHHGLEDDIQEAFDIVHASNMSKLDDNGKPIINGKNGAYDESRPMGKVLKSNNFKEPDFKNILEKYENR
jgi:predicted HAD superfamily Cof-like phosphohydrolase